MHYASSRILRIIPCPKRNFPFHTNQQSGPNTLVVFAYGLHLTHSISLQFLPTPTWQSNVGKSNGRFHWENPIYRDMEETPIRKKAAELVVSVCALWCAICLPRGFCRHIIHSWLTWVLRGSESNPINHWLLRGTRNASRNDWCKNPGKAQRQWHVRRRTGWACTSGPETLWGASIRSRILVLERLKIEERTLKRRERLAAEASGEDQGWIVKTWIKKTWIKSLEANWWPLSFARWST